MEVLRIQSGSDGVIQLPRELLDEMNFEEGQNIEVERDVNSLRVSLSVADRIRRAQAIVRKYIPPGESLVDDLLAERRREAAND